MESGSTRRTGRVATSLRLLVSGNDANGRLFMEESSTVEISCQGARIISKRLLKANNEVNVRIIATGSETDMRVIGQIADTPLGYHYGTRFSAPTGSFWGIHFPSTPESENATPGVVLECERCLSSEEVSLIDFEVEVFAAQGNLERPCKKCGISTAWRLANRQPVPPPVPGGVERAPLPAALKPGGSERRRQKRLPLNMRACIRTITYGDEVVPTENVSKGGFSFKSTDKYGVDMVLEVCVPYSAGSGDIFTSAKIVGRRPLSSEGGFVYAVSYRKRSARQL